METDGLPKPDNVIFGEIQVLLAENELHWLHCAQVSPCSRCLFRY